MNGYWWVDLRRGVEYILDIGIKLGVVENRGIGKEVDMIIRCGKMFYIINFLIGIGSGGIFWYFRDFRWGIY